MSDGIEPLDLDALEAQDLRMIAAALGGAGFQYAPSLLSAAQSLEMLIAEVRRLRTIEQRAEDCIAQEPQFEGPLASLRTARFILNG